MMLTKTILASAIIGAAVAAPQPAPEPMYEIIQVRQIISSIVGAATSIAGGGGSSIANAATSLASVAVSRASSLTASGALTGCVVPDSILSIVTGVPVPSPELASAILTATDPCHPSFTGRVSSQYVSYTSAALSWASKNSAALNSWQSDYKKNCPLATGLLASTTAGVCGTTSATGSRTSGVAGPSGAAGNGTTGASGSGASTQVVGVGAAVFAGFAGVLAML